MDKDPRFGSQMSTKTQIKKSPVLQCPFCLRTLPPSFNPHPIVLPCCAKYACAPCGSPLLLSTNWTCLGCFKISKTTFNHNQYVQHLQTNADTSNCYHSQIILGFLALEDNNMSGAIHYWLMAESNNLNSKMNILLPAVVQFKLGEAWESGNLKGSNHLMEASKWFDRSASQQYVPAMLKIGHMYEHGMGARKSHAAASGWYGKAAACGNVPAMRKLGIVMATGMGQAQANPVTACRWWKEASDLGDTESMVMLGKAYTNGVGVEQNNRQAFILFKEAAEQGHAEAMFHLAEAHRIGRGVPKRNLEQCVHWYKKSAASGYATRANGELRMLGALVTSPTTNPDGGGVVKYVQRPTTCHYCDKPEDDFDDVMIMCRRCSAVGYCCDMCKYLDFRKCHKKECGLLSCQKEVSAREEVQTESFVFESDSAWQQYQSDDGEWYWYNNNTAESSWTDPRGGEKK